MEQEIIRIDLNGVNCYLGKEDGNFVLFDTGGHLTLDKPFTDRQELLLEELEKAGCQPENLKLIVLTHGDNDHTANAAFLREKFEAPVAMHPADLPLVDNPNIDMIIKNFRFKSSILRIMSFFMKKLIIKVTVKTLENFKSFTPNILLNDGDSLAEYSFNAQIIHLPGHTNGSIGILTASGELIAGDTLTNQKKPGAAPNACDFKTLAKSVNRLKAMNIKYYYPGHGEPFGSF